MKKIGLFAVIFACLLAFCGLSAGLAASEEQDAFEAAFAASANGGSDVLSLESAYAARAMYSQSGIRAYLKGLGFEEGSIKLYDYSTQESHSVALALARRLVKDAQGNPITLYAVIVRGTGSSIEWISNFDIGDGTKAYGFDQAAQRVMQHFIQYVNDYPPLEGTLLEGRYKVWASGHSRGAAVVNLLAGAYLPVYTDAENVYAYAYATPNVDKEAEPRANIINFVIAGDFVPQVPLSAWGFGRYGITVTYALDTIGDMQLNSGSNVDRLVDLMAAIVPSQETYSIKARAFIQSLEDDPAARDADMGFMMKGLLSEFLTAETLPNVLTKLLQNVSMADVMKYVAAGKLPVDLLFNGMDIEDIIAKMGVSHGMDTHVLWLEETYGQAQ